jgi:hypothetical protein
VTWLAHAPVAAINADVTPPNIHQTICVLGRTASALP